MMSPLYHRTVSQEPSTTQLATLHLFWESSRLLSSITNGFEYDEAGLGYCVASHLVRSVRSVRRGWRPSINETFSGTEHKQKVC